MGAIWVVGHVRVSHGRKQRTRDTYNQVAEENLQDLGSQTGAAAKDLLQNPDQEVAQRRADKGAVGGHLGHARCKVVAVLVAVLGQP